MTGRKRKLLCTALVCANMLLSLCACERPIGGLETVTDLETVSPAEGICCAGAGPLSVYTGAELDLLMPLSEYSWERKYPPEFVMIHFTSAVVEHRDDPYNEDHLRALFPQPRQLRLQIVPLGVAGGKLPAILGHRHELHKDDHLAAAVGQRL